jgi:ABC-type transport system involved in cytochrome c biogenesis ATPase subunit
MRIRHIKINSWRHFSNIELTLPDDAGLVCIVGANGTGKSHLLELIAACAHRLGLSQGIEAPRGDPFNDKHDFSLTFYVAEGVSDAVDKDLVSDESFKDWNRRLCIQSQKGAAGNTNVITAGGITDANQATNFARRVIEKLQASKSVHFISLDADRAYPKKNIQIHEIAQAYEIDWGGSEYKRGRSFKSTATLYDEWIKYLLAQENQAGTALIKNIRNAREAGQREPTFADHFLGYKDALRQVLPHVIFAGIDPRARRILFNTTGLELSFDQLSGGEREIAFLVGQIDRFGLRQGLFLLDEPELHLNADLIRVWVGYLTSTVKTGQVWLATHSLEAVEAAGQQATFVLERNEETRRVDSLTRLDQRPVLSALSRAVGTPAFSISKLRFVFVEGEESVGERERFRKLAGLPQDVRFMECGSCTEVVRRVGTIKALASESETGIRIGGIVDRDFRSPSEVDACKHGGVFTLPVHEVENYFLHPGTLDQLLAQNGCNQVKAIDLIQQAADARAGSWIFQYTMSTPNAKHLPEIAPTAKDIAKNLSWISFDASTREASISRIEKASSFDDANQAKFGKLLRIAINAYESKRVDAALWKTCEGKQVLIAVSRTVGFADAASLSQAAFAAWARNGAQLPNELIEMRQYLQGL